MNIKEVEREIARLKRENQAILHEIATSSSNAQLDRMYCKNNVRIIELSILLNQTGAS